METAIDSSVGIVAYLALFGGVGFVFVFVNLLLGRFLRPANPTEEKLEIYECGEPAIGSSFVQFDLRFYVVALVFIIFDVEVAFLFPWATVFGKASHVAGVLDPGDAASASRLDLLLEVARLRVPSDSTSAWSGGELVKSDGGQLSWTPDALAIYREMGVSNPELPAGESASQANRMLMYGQLGEDGELEFAGFGHILVVAAIAASFFFVVLLVGFAYEWRTGALDWVRAVTNSPPAAIERRSAKPSSPQESVLSA